MNGHISPMYKMKPQFELSSDIHVKTTMYGMKNLQSSPPQETERSQCDLSERDLLIKEIENKQAEILKALAGIRAQMATLKQELCKGSETKSTSKSHVTPARKFDFSEFGIIHEVVINASVQKPPYSLLAISRLWDGMINVDLSCHRHSSLKSIPEELINFSKLVHRSKASNAANLKIRLVWKEMENDCEFIVSPFKFVPLLGEVNMLRFFNRMMNNTSTAETETLIDGKLDACHSLKYAASGKEVYAALKVLSDELGENSTWFCGNGVSFVDLAAWSAVKSIQNPKLSKPMARWFQESEQYFGSYKESKEKE